MAVTFNDLVNADDVAGVFSAAAGTDAPSVRNAAGTNVISSTVFDYFSDAPSVNQSVNFNSNKWFKDIVLYVGTAMNGTPVFVWEYKVDATWTTLKVINGNAITKTGQQTISFTPPSDWMGVTQERPLYQVRMRITDVTGVTEGGAQSTQKVKWGNFALKHTGTSQTYATIQTYNDTTAYTLLPATTSTTGLIPIGMSHNYLGMDDNIKVILASTTAGAGDTVTLTGIDLDGTSISENIDVSAGNGTYTSAKRYKNLTQVDCNGFADGTVNVTTTKMGLMRTVGSAITLACHHFIGDGSTATTFTETLKNITFLANCFPGYGDVNATVTLGTQNVGGKVDATSNWVNILMVIGSRIQYSPRHILNRGTLSLYGCNFFCTPAGTKYFRFNGTVNGRDSKIYLSGLGVSGFNTITNVWIDGIDAEEGWFPSTATVNGFKTNSNILMLNQRGAGQTFTLYNSNFEALTSMNNLDAGRGFKFINCNLTSADITNGASNSNAGDGIYIQNYYDLVVKDISNNPINAARVKIIDSANAVTSVTTDVNGNITQQVLTHQKGTWPVPGPAISWATLSPFKIKVMEYSYKFYQIIQTLSAAKADTAVVESDPYVTATEATANAFTGISINWAAGTITVTQAHSVNDLYDYVKAQNISNPTYAQPLTTADGNTFISSFNITVDGVVLSGAGKKLDLGSGTFSLINGASTTATVKDSTGTLVLVTLNNVVVGSRCRIEKQSDKTELLNVEATSSTVSTSYKHTADTNVNIIVRKASGGTKYLPYSTTGTITSTGLTVRVEQIQDNIVT